MSPSASSLPTERPALCVSIHDVAPATWNECLQLMRAVRQVADIPLTWLVVPHYHGSPARLPEMEIALGELLSGGHELALHGYTHLDEAPVQGTAMSRFSRSIYTQREGEFAAIAVDDARRRLALGLAWFHDRGWPADGFVPPAWLLGPQAWQALREFPFVYTSTFTHLHLLRQGQAVFAPSLVYAARNGAGRALTPIACNAAAHLLAASPLVRLALHPRDAHYPKLLLHAQRIIGRLLASRVPQTKAAFARNYQYGPHMPPKPQREREYPRL